ncbi:MAG: twin-arginine translocation signal domain-containing protein, partial [Bryobacteraceae bacterium]
MTVTSRRQFLKWAAAAAVPAGERITVGCIGTGWMGSANVASFADEPGAQVVAVCDVDAQHLDAARDAVNRKYQNTDCKA